MNGRRARPVRQFLSAAMARRDDAEYLRLAGRTHGAVYLAGYAVECSLKSLILSTCPEHEQRAMIASFHGARAHDCNWLRALYRRRGGPLFDSRVIRAFVTIEPWSTELRYHSNTIYRGDTGPFFAAIDLILSTIRERVT